MLVLEEIEEDMKRLRLALDFGVAGCILYGEKGDCNEVTRYQSRYEIGISSLTERNFKFFLIGSVLWEKERIRCPDSIILEVLDDWKKKPLSPNFMTETAPPVLQLMPAITYNHLQ